MIATPAFGPSWRRAAIMVHFAWLLSCTSPQFRSPTLTDTSTGKSAALVVYDFGGQTSELDYVPRAFRWTCAVWSDGQVAVNTNGVSVGRVPREYAVGALAGIAAWMELSELAVRAGADTNYRAIILEHNDRTLSLLDGDWSLLEKLDNGTRRLDEIAVHYTTIPDARLTVAPDDSRLLGAVIAWVEVQRVLRRLRGEISELHPVESTRFTFSINAPQ